MGIPKFYRWLSERYPLINQPIASTHVPVVDNLYLDMNGIIHNCTHGNDPNVKLTEEEMILKVFGYIEKLFQIVQPQKLLFAAIDGCAPRAKMNQQRGRRFKSAKEAAENAKKRAEEEAAEPGPPRDAFDSNCITPGTPFMGCLAAHLCFFFRKKIAEDPAWQKPRIIFSGHDVPGEGEHKIMEHIRWAKKQPGFEANQRHCLYGLDADLIMLSLVSHEPHFCLLREVVSFSGGSKGQPSREVLTNPKKEHFVLFQIGLLREYLELEFCSTELGFPFDTERLIDDFVLFCMLIGNDFLPTLPTLDVNEGALDRIFGIYKQLLPHMGGFLTDTGKLDLRRFEMLLAELAKLELETLEQRAADAEYMENKRSKSGRGRGPQLDRKPKAAAIELDDIDAGIAALMSDMGSVSGTGMPPEVSLKALEEAAADEPAAGRSAEPTMMSREARRLVQSGQGQAGLQQWKERYYREKLEIDPTDPSAVRSAVVAFVEGLMWVLEYYYRGVISWEWFYPFHYSPMISDMSQLAGILPSFRRGEPFTPYQQLLAVQPAASYKLLPKPYQWLMTEERSPIIDFYPLNFTLDAEGKRQDWEAVVVLDFIDVPRLRQAETAISTDQLTPEEQQRNRFGPLLHFVYDAGSEESSFCASTLPSRVPSVRVSRSRCERHEPLPPLPEGEPGFQPRLAPGTTTGKGGPPGYPTLKTLELGVELKQAAVEVLGQPSKKESLILTIKGKQAAAALASAAQLAPGLVGQRIWIKWPYLLEAEVQAVSDETAKVGPDKVAKLHSKNQADAWRQDVSRLSSIFRKKHGIEIGHSKLLLHVHTCEGLMRRADGSVEKRFSSTAVSYPVQASLKNNPSPDPRLDPGNADYQASMAYPAGTVVIFVGRTYFGCLAEILPPLNESGGKNGRLRVKIQPLPPSASTAVHTAKRVLAGFKVNFMPSHLVARRLQMSPRCLSLLTSSVYVRVDDKRVDLGLCVKNAPKGLCVPDYVKPQHDQQGWMYSQPLVQLLEAYKARFAWVMKAVEGSGEGRADFDASDIFPGQTSQQRMETVMRVRSWLTAQPISRRVLVKTTAVVAADNAIRVLQQALPPSLASQPPTVELAEVPPGLLLAPAEAGIIPNELSGGDASLGDRVAFVSRGGPPPLGARGTVVGIHEEDYEILFDQPFAGGNDLQGRCNGNCGAVVGVEELLILSTAKPVPNGVSEMPLRNTKNAGLNPASSANRSQSEKASPVATPSASPWLSHRRSLDATTPATTPAAAGQPKKAGRNCTQAAKPLSLVVNPTTGAKGFTMGRGRKLSKEPASNGSAAPPAQSPKPPGLAAAPPGIPTPHPLLLALKGQQLAAPEPDFEHKVHHGMSAAKEILRLSQQDLTALDPASCGELALAPPSQPQTALAAPPGLSLLAMLHLHGAPPTVLQAPELPTPSTPFSTAWPAGVGASGLPPVERVESTAGEPSFQSWLASRGSAGSSGNHNSSAPTTTVHPSRTPASLPEDTTSGSFWDSAPAAINSQAVEARFAADQAQPAGATDAQTFWSQLAGCDRPTAGQEAGKAAGGGAALLSLLRQPLNPQPGPDPRDAAPRGSQQPMAGPRPLGIGAPADQPSAVHPLATSADSSTGRSLLHLLQVSPNGSAQQRAPAEAYGQGQPGGLAQQAVQSDTLLRASLTAGAGASHRIQPAGAQNSVGTSNQGPAQGPGPRQGSRPSANSPALAGLGPQQLRTPASKQNWMQQFLGKSNGQSKPEAELQPTATAAASSSSVGSAAPLPSPSQLPQEEAGIRQQQTRSPLDIDSLASKQQQRHGRELEAAERDAVLSASGGLDKLWASIQQQHLQESSLPGRTQNKEAESERRA